MEREIKFRGKRLDNGEWVYGSYLHQYFSVKNQRLIDAIAYTDRNQTLRPQVDPETVGQSTGRKCKDVEIFDGDILAPDGSCNWAERYVVSWNEKHCCFTCIQEGKDLEDDDNIRYHLLSNMRLDVVEIVGNIHDSGTPHE